VPPARQCGERLGYAAQRTEENARGAGFPDRIRPPRSLRRTRRFATEFIETISSGARQLGDIDRFDDFVWRERGGERFDETPRPHTASRRTANIDRGAERGKGERPIRRRIGVSEAAADGARLRTER